MKILIQKQFNKSGEEYEGEKKVEVEITREDDEILIEIEGARLIIPLEAFIGILS